MVDEHRESWRLDPLGKALGLYFRASDDFRMKQTWFMKWWILVGAGLAAAGGAWAVESMGAGTSTNDARATEVKLNEDRSSIWDGAVGAGFRRSIEHVSLVAGVAPGFHRFGSPQAHHLALAGVSYGKMWGNIQAKDHWWRGNWEWRVEMLAGSEFSPSVHYFVGITPHVRYNYATGTRWIPYVDFGTGISATSIGPPDLGGWFQFNTQLGVGVNWFLKDNLALSLDVRGMHVSSAGIYQPNAGMNNVLFLAGMNWFF